MEEPSNSILIVEDDRDLVKLIKINLEDLGYVVHTAGDGLEALKLFNEKDPSIIILDIMLPKMDGFEVCKQIRKENRKVPIMILTAKAEEVDTMWIKAVQIAQVPDWDSQSLKKYWSFTEQKSL